MMTVHVLHAGDGYTYLTRQVASGDVRREPGQSLTGYYMAVGNPPGVWVGSGIGDLGVSGPVSEAQMRALFGEGLHPDADRVVAEALLAGRSQAEAAKAAHLGRRFPVFKAAEPDGFEEQIAGAFADFRASFGRAPEPGVERDLIRWDVAGKVLRAGGEAVPSDAQIARYLAARGAETRQPVAGYDLVFTPTKSVSVLWGLGDARTREEITEAHRAAWTQALAWVEKEGALTRAGKAGVAQIDTHGLVATAWDHMDSRTGDPNLHTHVAVSNKVLGVDGKWRALDGRVLHALGVAASERYNTLIESELTRRLGVRFAPEDRGDDRQAVREVVGIDKRVRDGFSQRRRSIEETYGELLAEYRRAHGHEPPRAVQYRLAQQATLSTRQAKEAGVPLARRLGEWRATAARVLGSEELVDGMVAGALARGPATNGEWPSVETLTAQVLDGVAQRRATWGRWHLSAEAQRVARTVTQGGDAQELAEQLTERAVAASVLLAAPDTNPAPEALRRGSGESVYAVHGSERYSSDAVLGAEDELVAAARTGGGLVVPAAAFEAAVLAVEESAGVRLNEGQRRLAAQFAGGGHLIEAGIGPAGTGKTTAMRVLVQAVEAAGGRVLGLGPSAAAAAVLAGETGATCDTVHKLLAAHQRAATAEDVPPGLWLDERTVVLVDEAGMAGTPQLAQLLHLARDAGAAVRLLGDPAQLGAIGAGGALRLIDQQVGAAHLDQVHRFATPGEARASLNLRDGVPQAVDWYVQARRTHGGTPDDMVDELYAAWWADQQAGRVSIMVAGTNDDVVALSSRARLDRVSAGQVEADGVELHDGSRAGLGDLVVTRANDRRLRAGRRGDWVKNGDMWTVVARGEDGSLDVQHTSTQTRVTLPAEYVATKLELAYAATVHRVQGMTVDTSHTLVTPSTTREQLYVAATRGRDANHLYVVVDEPLDVDLHEQPDPARAVADTLRRTLERSGAELSATETLATQFAAAESLARLVPAYQDAYDRVWDPDSADRMAQAVRLAAPQIAEQVVEDDSWLALASRLTRHEAAGADVVELVRAAVESRPLDDADSAASVLHWRIGAPEDEAQPGGLPAWIAAPPAETVPAPRSTDDAPVPVDEPPAAGDVDPAARARAVEITTAAWRWWQDQTVTTTWADTYLVDRGLAGVEHGVAPATWTGLVDDLVARGYRHDELVTAGVATTTRDGRVIDRFRDRLIFPVRDVRGDVVGVTARINPGAQDDERAPKYLNTPETPAYRKRELLLGLDDQAVARLAAGARPVLVEGPTDLAAVAIAAPDLVPLAACGTGVTEAHLAAIRRAAGRDLSDLVVATDADPAGRKAAARVWTMLTPAEASTARAGVIPDGDDPAVMVQTGRSDQLAAALTTGTRPLTTVAVDVSLAAHNLTWPEGRIAALRDAARTAAAHIDTQAMAGVAAHLDTRLGTVLDRDTIQDEVIDATLTATADRPRPAPIEEPRRDPQVGAWLRRQADRITARLDHLTDQVAAQPPAWAADLAPAPADPARRASWRAGVRDVVAYRDQWGVDSDTALGPEPSRGEQAEAYQRATASLAALAVDHDDSAGTPSRADELAARIAALRTRPRAQGGPSATDEATDRLRRAQRMTPPTHRPDPGRTGPQI